MGGWPVAATPPPHTDKAKVNPFMQWAVASIQGFYFSGPQPGATPPTDLPGHPPSVPALPSPASTPGHSQAKVEEQARPAPVTISASTALETGRQAVQSMGPGHYNHSLHPMVPIDPAHHHHQQQLQQQQHHTQHQQQPQQQQPPQQQPPQQHQQQQQQQSGELGTQPTHPSHGPSNDTAFPGAPHRHSYNVQGGGQHSGAQGQSSQIVHNSHTSKQVQGEKQAVAPLTKNKLYTEENGQIVAFNGSQEHLEMHRRGVKVERVYDCTECDKAFTREEHLKRHAKSHTDEPVHRCEVVGCNKAYTRKERLTRHYKVAHLGQEPERPFWCSECGKDFQRKEHLTRHQRNIHGPGGSVGLAQSHHSDQSQGSISPVSMTVLGPAQPINHHSQGQQQGAGVQGSGGGGGGGNNHGQGQLHCTYEGCPKTYSRREHLNRHIKLHMGIEPERPYYCLDCGKTFTRKEHLLRHRRSHTGETPYACPGVDCSKQFARKEHLKRHMRVHTGEHPYPCSECGRSFGRRERLLKHLKSHGIGVMPGAPIRTVHHLQHHQHQPKKEFKKEPEFSLSDQQSMPHGVFGDQTNHLLRMIAQKGPLSPEQLGMAQQAQPNAEQHFLSNPEVARALSNPDIVRAFSNPEVVKAFAFSPPKRGSGSAPTPPATQAPPTSQASQAPVVTRGPDIANSPAVPPELSKLPSGFSIFPVVPNAGAGGGQVVTQDQSQVCVSNPANSYYQAGPSYVASMAPHRAELTTIPMAWTGWPMTTMQPVNMRSPAKLEPTEAKHWEPAAAAYFRSPFS